MNNILLNYLNGADTPAIVYSETLIYDAFRKMRGYLNPQIKILYSVKANRNPDVVRTISKYADGLEFSSISEMSLFEDLETRKYCSIPGLTEPDVEKLLKAKININFDSINQVQKFSSEVEGLPIGVRVRNTNDNSRFGTNYGEKELELLSKMNVKIGRLHYHFDHKDLDPFRDSVQYVESLLETQYLQELTEVDFGGGAYEFIANGEWTNYCKIINDFSERHPNISVMIEPGQAFIGNNGFLVTSVVDIKEDIHTLVLDSSKFNLFNWHTPILLNNSAQEGIKYRICGNSLLEGDVFCEEVVIKEAREGMKFVFFPAGAYVSSMARTLHAYEIPKESLCNDIL